jgi:hypothetical protein
LLRRTEWLLGLTAGVLGGAAAYYIADGMIYRQASTRANFPETASAWMTLLATAIGAGVGAGLHARGGRLLGLALLWACPAVLLLYWLTTILPLVRFGSPYLTYLPPMLLATAAAAVGSVAQVRRSG